MTPYTLASEFRRKPSRGAEARVWDFREGLDAYTGETRERCGSEGRDILAQNVTGSILDMKFGDNNTNMDHVLELHMIAELWDRTIPLSSERRTQQALAKADIVRLVNSRQNLNHTLEALNHGKYHALKGWTASGTNLDERLRDKGFMREPAEQIVREMTAASEWIIGAAEGGGETLEVFAGELAQVLDGEKFVVL